LRGMMGALLLALGWEVLGGETAAPVPSLPAVDKRLLQAAQHGNLALLKGAIDAGADVNCRGTNGLPPLLELLRAAAGPLDSERHQCVACLLEHGAAIDAMDSDRRTPLIYATRLGDLETVRLLVEAEAYVKARDRFHKSALFYAVEEGRRDIVLYLAKNGDLVSMTVKERKALR